MLFPPSGYISPCIQSPEKSLLKNVDFSFKNVKNWWKKAIIFIVNDDY